MNAIAHRYWSKSCPFFFVESVKGEKGDWGYTTDYKKALPLTPTQQQRFAADCRAAGVKPAFTPI